MGKAIQNRTPHNITVYVAGDKDTCPLTFAPSGKVAIVGTVDQEHVATLDNGVRVYSPPSFTGILDGFPSKNAMHPDLIVSMVAGNHIPKWYRGNVYIPDTGPDSVVRDDDDGKILGVKRLCIVHEGARE